MNTNNQSTSSVGGSRRLYSYVSGSDDEVEVIDDSSGLPRAVTPSGSRKMHGGGRTPYGDPTRPVGTGLHWLPPDSTPRDVPPPAEPDDDDDDDDDDASEVSSPSWVRSESEDDESDGRGRHQHHGRGVGGGGVRKIVALSDAVEDGIPRRSGYRRNGGGGNAYSSINCNG